MPTITCPLCKNSLDAPDYVKTIKCPSCCQVFSVVGDTTISEKDFKGIADTISDITEKALATVPDELLFKPNLTVNFKKEMYPKMIVEYETLLRPAISLLDEAYATFGEQSKDMLEKFASELCERITKNVSGNKLFSTVNNAPMTMIDARFLVSTYLIPGIIETCCDVSDPLADAIITAWNNKFKKHRLIKSNYSEISAGFSKGLCFITTAVCRETNKPDDCRELTLLRQYRDGWLSELPYGDSYIKLYYALAPAILRGIESHNEKEKIYKWLSSEYIDTCADLIEQGKMQRCLSLYTEMLNEVIALV